MDVSDLTNNITTLSVTESEDLESTTGLTQLISTVVTVVFLIIALLGIYGMYRVCCKTRSKHDEAERGNHGRNKDFFDQFNVNGSQMNIESEERKFINPAAKITSESESLSSNVSNASPPEAGGGGISTLVKSLHGDRFSINKVRERSARTSANSLKIRVPKHFVQTGSKDDDQFALALIDHRSNTIHNIDIRDCVIMDSQSNSAVTPTSALFAQKWKDKTRQRRHRRSSVEGRPRLIRRQSSCPSSMSAKGFVLESLSSHSDESILHNIIDPLGSTAIGASLSSIDEATHKLYDSNNLAE